MPLSQILFSGPDYALALAMMKHSVESCHISVEPYAVETHRSTEIVKAMRAIYSRQKFDENIYVMKLSAPKTVIIANHAVQTTFDRSDTPTDRYPVNNFVVVSTAKDSQT